MRNKHVVIMSSITAFHFGECTVELLVRRNSAACQAYKTGTRSPLLCGTSIKERKAPLTGTRCPLLYGTSIRERKAPYLIIPRNIIMAVIAQTEYANRAFHRFIVENTVRRR